MYVESSRPTMGAHRCVDVFLRLFRSCIYIFFWVILALTGIQFLGTFRIPSTLNRQLYTNEFWSVVHVTSTLPALSGSNISRTTFDSWRNITTSGKGNTSAEPLKKIAFMFLTYGEHRQPTIWQDFFQNADSKLYTLHVHPKYPAKVTQQPFREAIIQNLVQTSWGAGLSLVNATIELLKAALEDSQVKRFVLLSDSCIPLRSFAETYAALMEGNQTRFTLHGDFIQAWGASREVAFKIQNTTFAKRLNLCSTCCVKHQQFFSMIREHADTVLKQREYYSQHLNRMRWPDEGFFGSLLTAEAVEPDTLQFDQITKVLHRPLDSALRSGLKLSWAYNYTVYRGSVNCEVRRQRAAHPSNLNPARILWFRSKTPCLFARKVPKNIRISSKLLGI